MDAATGHLYRNSYGQARLGKVFYILVYTGTVNLKRGSELIKTRHEPHLSPKKSRLLRDGLQESHIAELWPYTSTWIFK